jgi:hypothetical protein
MSSWIVHECKRQYQSVDHDATSAHSPFVEGRRETAQRFADNSTMRILPARSAQMLR